MARLGSETIAETLIRLDVVHPDRISVFANATRDKENLRVYRDELTAVIFIDDFYVGEDEYKDGSYRASPNAGVIVESTMADYEDDRDTARRVERYRQFYIAKNVCDFGCGAGRFLRQIKGVARHAVGIELQRNYVDALRSDGIHCYATANEVPSELDTVFMFHSFEHLPNPTDVLRQVHDKLDENGRIIIEVPHARDFLLESLNVQEFVEFTLWSQHLILHTRESLRAFLRDAGFCSITIEGVQRYDLSNHLHWLKHGKPGGHKSNLSVMQTVALTSSYAEALGRIDQNDTLVAIASKNQHG